MADVTGTMNDPGPGSEPADRLSRAGDLFEYVRANSDGGRLDPQALSVQFGLPVEAVERLLATATPKTGKAAETWLAEIRAKFKSLWLKLFGLVTAQPIASIILACLPFFLLLLPGFRDAIPKALARTITGAGVLMLWIPPTVFYATRKSRYVILAGGLAAMLLILVFQQVPQRAVNSFGPGQMKVLFFVSAFFLGLIYVAIGEVFVLLGGIGFQRRKRMIEREQTRQQLLARYFQLQSALAEAKNLAKPERKLTLFLRRYPFLISFTVSAVLGVAVALLAQHYHYDPLNPVQVKIDSTGATTKGNAALPPSAYLLGSTLILMCSLLALVCLAASVTRYRAVLWICLGSILGGFLGMPFMPNGTDRMQAALSQSFVLSAVNLIWYVVITSLTFVGFQMHRSWLSQKLLEANDYNALLSELLDVQWRLAATPTDVAILVVDVAGSTALKQGEEALIAEYSFGSYQSWIAEIVSTHGGRIEATAGDGVIAAFGNPEHSVTAAKQILGDLDRFNATGNRLAGKFRLRVALHLGQVYADLKKVQFSHVIDVAAHVEKVAPVNGIAFTEAILAKLDPMSLLEEGPQVDGMRVQLLRAVG